MKKLIFSALFLMSAFSASAQTEIGLQLSPSLAGNRVIATDVYGFKSEGVQPRYGIGLVVDKFFSENYAFSTGLFYRTKGGKISYRTERIKYEPTTAYDPRITDKFNIQYLEVPITLKLYTNEVALDTRLYFQLGTSVNTRISATVNGEKVEPSNNAFSGRRTTRRFNIVELDALVGGGLEMQLGENTKIFGGVSYHRGLTDADNYFEKDEIFGDKDIAVKNGAFALDLGIKF
jgi:hypothetical protein